MLFWVWVCAVVPLVWVMAVGVGVSGFWWCCFQWWVAVVWVSRRVPGVGVCVLWLVSGVSGACVGWLVLVGVVGVGVGVLWLVCVFWWFRMLMCSCFFLFSGFVFLSCVVWLITGCLGFWCVGWVLGCLFSCAGRSAVFVFGVLSVGLGGCCWLGWLFGGFGWWLVRVCFVCVFPWWLLCARSLGGWFCCWAGLVVCLGGLLGLLFFVCWLVCVRKCVGGCGCGCAEVCGCFGWRVACVAG